jgi:hypothetical protein
VAVSATGRCINLSGSQLLAGAGTGISRRVGRSCGFSDGVTELEPPGRVLLLVSCRLVSCIQLSACCMNTSSCLHRKAWAASCVLVLNKHQIAVAGEHWSDGVTSLVGCHSLEFHAAVPKHFASPSKPISAAVQDSNRYCLPAGPACCCKH